MRLEKQTLEHNQMHFLRDLGVDITDASFVKLYKRESDDTVVPWNIICSDRKGLFVNDRGGRESVGVHYYPVDSDEYDHSLKADNVVYTVEELVKKLPESINGIKRTFFSYPQNSQIFYMSFPTTASPYAFTSGKTMKDTAYKCLLTIAEAAQKDPGIKIPMLENSNAESQFLSHSQMEKLRSLGIDTGDASMVKFFYKASDNSYIDASMVIPTEQGYITNEGGHPEEASAYFYAAESDDYPHAMRYKNTVYSAQDLLSKLPVELNVRGDVYKSQVTQAAMGGFKISFETEGHKELKGMSFSSENLVTAAMDAIASLAEKGLWREDVSVRDKNLNNLLCELLTKREAGKITIHEAALELNQFGFTKFVDEEKTEQMLKGVKELAANSQNSPLIIRASNKTLVIGKENAVLIYDNKVQQLPLLTDLLSINDASADDIHDWGSFLRGKAVAINDKTVISLYKGIGEYSVKTFPINLFLTQYVQSKDTILNKFENGKLENLRLCTVDLKVSDMVFLNFFYHADYGNKEIEDNYCSVKLNEALKAYDVKGVGQLKEKLTDGHLNKDTWKSLVSELKANGLKPLVEESGKYLSADTGMVSEDY